MTGCQHEQLGQQQSHNQCPDTDASYKSENHRRGDAGAPHCDGSHDATDDGPEADELEAQALGKIIHAFRCYSACLDAEVRRWEINYASLPPRHQLLLQHLPAKAAAARRAARQNQLFIKALLMAFAGPAAADGTRAVPPPPPEQAAQQQAGAPKSSDANMRKDDVNNIDDSDIDDDIDSDTGTGVPPMLSAAAVQHANKLGAAGQLCSPGDAEKVRYVLKNLVRDWSAEGALERSQCYEPLLQALRAAFEGWTGPHRPRVLLPGAGLGRLAVEVAAAGFEAQGNEFSYYMLSAASFMLNCSAVPEQWTLHPWLHMTCNVVADEDQLRGVSIPDVLPCSLVPPGSLSMCAGDFVEVYSRPEAAGTFDAVVTCFFIDTAHNVLEYLETIHRVLRPGGIWLHLGPLLWHWADGQSGEVSLELSLADVQRAAQLMGFTPTSSCFVDAAYIANVRSMFKTVYQAALWSMTKTGEQLPEDLEELVQLLAVQEPTRPSQVEAGSEDCSGSEGCSDSGGG